MEDIKRTDVRQKKLVIIQISEYNRIEYMIGGIQ